MKASCTLTFTFTKKPATAVKADLDKVVDEIKQRSIGNKKAVFKIKSELKGAHYKLTLDTENINLPDFILQLDRRLKALLGKNFKVGVQGYVAEDYKQTFPLEKVKKHDFKIPFVDKLDIKDKQASIFYKKLDPEFIENNHLHRTINLIKEKIDHQYYEGKAEYHELLFKSKQKTPVWAKDPSEEMQKLGWIKQGPTKGKWYYGPQMTAIMKAMEKIAVEELLNPLEFVEIMDSNIVSEDIWIKTGHLVGMPMEIYYVCEPATRDPKEWEGFIDEVKITKKVPYDKFDSLLKKKPLQGLAYAQCPSVYWAFTNKIIANDSLPILIYDKTQNSFRYESGGRHGIERVDEFHRIEVVYIGTPDQLKKLKDKLFDRYKNIFENIFEIEWRTAWVTPFYLQQAGVDYKEKDKVQGTMDFEAWLPYRGTRDKSEWLEFQNMSIVGDKYSKAFQIKAQKGELWSGCTGIGLERWCAAFLAQKGLDPKNWPKGFKKYLSKLPEGFKFF
ncbi:MAG: aminoacyl--tRNA ligase-related protein [archaeon]